MTARDLDIFAAALRQGKEKSNEKVGEHMKGKCLLCLLLMLPMLLMPSPVAASGEQAAALDGPSVIAPGEEFTLQYHVSEAVAAFTLELEYDSEWLEYVGYRSVKGWSILANGDQYTTYGAMNEEFAQVLATELMIFTFQVKENASGGGQPSVLVRNAVLTSAELADVDVSDAAWHGTVMREKEETHQPVKSSDSRLQSLQITGIPLAFTPDQTTYSVQAPASLRSLAITAIPTHPAASVHIDGNRMTVGETSTVKITVTAEDGSTRTTYCLLVTCADAQTAAASEEPVTSKPPESLPASSTTESNPVTCDSETAGEDSAACTARTDAAGATQATQTTQAKPTTNTDTPSGGEDAWDKAVSALIGVIGIAILFAGILLLCLRRHHDEKTE